MDLLVARVPLEGGCGVKGGWAAALLYPSILPEQLPMREVIAHRKVLSDEAGALGLRLGNENPVKGGPRDGVEDRTVPEGMFLFPDPIDHTEALGRHSW